MNKLAGIVAASAFAIACRDAPPPPPATAASPAPPAASGTVPHGDHNPRHGGVVMMKGDLHYEVVVEPSGRMQLFFSDAVREDLPASIASRVFFALHRPGEADESIELHIDETGESWVGAGPPIADPKSATVRVGFTIADDPYEIDVPLGGGKTQ